MQGLHLITKLRKNMHNQLLDFSDKLHLPKRVIIESMVDELKNVSQIELSRDRGPLNFLVHLMAGSSPTAICPRNCHWLSPCRQLPGLSRTHVKNANTDLRRTG